MNRILKRSIAAVLIASASTSQVFAADLIINDAYQGCSCVTNPAGAHAGSVVSGNGQVVVDNAAFSKGDKLSVGSEVSVSSGAAVVQVGQSCTTSVPANSTLSISQPGGAGSQLCVAVNSGSGAFNTAGGGSGVFGSPLVGALVIGGLVAGGIALANDGDDSRPAASN